MKRIRISSGTKWEAIVGYSRVVKVGDEIFVTGTVAFAEDGELVGEHDAYVQACQCLRNINAALARVGASLKDVVRTRIYVTDIHRDWEAVGRAHAEFLGSARPATTMVEVRRLIDDRYLVEIEADARLGLDDGSGAAADTKAAEAVSGDRSPLRLEEAAFNDGPDIAALLQSASLPVPGDKDAPVSFLALRSGEDLLGCIGWEAHGARALLRSCAVAHNARGRGLGGRLVHTLGDRLATMGIGDLYLLTLDAAPFFARFGFAPVDREEVPAEVKSSREFELHQCDQAICMRASLPLADAPQSV